MDFRGRGNELQDRLTYFFEDRILTNAKLKELVSAIKNPILFRPVGGPSAAFGYEGALIIDYCDALLRAHRQGFITGDAVGRYCVAAEALVLSVAKVGIVALIDEATGYQLVRDKKALQAILDKFLRQHWAKWAKRFPDEFYEEMFRLKGWQWRGMKVNRPAVVGHYTNDVVYSRLAPGVLEELRVRNPSDHTGKRSQKHHQWLTDDIGHPALNQHLYALLAMMRAAPDWSFFRRLVDKSFPRIGQTYLLNIGENFPEEPERPDA